MVYLEDNIKKIINVFLIYDCDSGIFYLCENLIGLLYMKLG